MDDELLTVEQAAQKLQMHPDTVRRLLREKTLPGVKMGPRQWRVPASALRHYVNGQLGKPAAGEKESV
jgi:excisionase family DNA binding protein